MLLKGLYHNFYLRIAVFILLTIAGTYFSSPAGMGVVCPDLIRVVLLPQVSPAVRQAKRPKGSFHVRCDRQQ